MKKILFIASVVMLYACGNTEETVDFLEEGYSRGLNVAVIATGGKLIDFAKENGLPYIQIPDTATREKSPALTKLPI